MNQATHISVRKFAMDAVRPLAIGVVGHEQQNLMTMIEIIEVHVLLHLVSGSTVDLSAAQAYRQKIRAMSSFSTSARFSLTPLFIFEVALQFFAIPIIYSWLLVAN